MMSQIRLAHEIRLYTNISAKQRTVLINSACDVPIQISGTECLLISKFKLKSKSRLEICKCDLNNSFDRLERVSGENIDTAT